MDSLLAVAEGGYTFDWEQLTDEALSRWPGSVLIRATGPRTERSFGQLEVVGADGEVSLLINLLSGGEGMGVDGNEDAAAEFMAWLVARPGFPADSSVVITDWALDYYPLLPTLTAEQIRDAFVG